MLSGRGVTGAPGVRVRRGVSAALGRALGAGASSPDGTARPVGCPARAQTHAAPSPARGALPKWRSGAYPGGRCVIYPVRRREWITRNMYRGHIIFGGARKYSGVSKYGIACHRETGQRPARPASGDARRGGREPGHGCPIRVAPRRLTRWAQTRSSGAVAAIPRQTAPRAPIPHSPKRREWERTDSSEASAVRAPREGLWRGSAFVCLGAGWVRGIAEVDRSSNTVLRPDEY